MKYVLLLSIILSYISNSYADQVINDDLVVQSSLGVGQDVSNGEDFQFSTILLKENNLRIRFQDTSNSASFPTNDWELRANESTNGGANDFAIEDISSGRTPFSVLAGASDHALFIGNNGNVGFKTTTPSQDLHLVSGDTPAVRFEQSDVDGLGAQIWDVIANESGLSFLDVTNANVVPFRVRSGSTTNSLSVGLNGVGIGVSSPAYKLHVQQSENLQPALIENTQATSESRTVLQLKNNGPAGLQISNTNAAATPTDWELTVTDAGELIISQGGVAKITIDGTGNLTATGAVSDASDLNRKQSFGQVDPTVVLEKVADLPLHTWTYKEEDIRHIGPMAQDFYAAFSLGANDTTISKTDADGVALASIQALHANATQREQQLEALRKENRELEQRLERIEAYLHHQ
jgi:hypothetical protein